MFANTQLFGQTMAEARGRLSQRPHLARQTHSWCLRTSLPLGVTGTGKKGRADSSGWLREPRPGAGEIARCCVPGPVWRGSRGWAHPGGLEEPELVQKPLAGGGQGGLCRFTKTPVGPVNAVLCGLPQRWFL